jgi:hypothetical protein
MEQKRRLTILLHEELLPPVIHSTTETP